jgi:hypothetical protein
MLDEGWYGKPINDNVERWLGDDRFWVAADHWWAPEEVMDRLMDEYVTEDGTPAWSFILERLDSGEEPQSFVAYSDPGDPEDQVVVDYEHMPTTPSPTHTKPAFEVIEGGRSNDD